MIHKDGEYQFREENTHKEMVTAMDKSMGTLSEKSWILDAKKPQIILHKNMISRDECNTIFHRIAEENDYSEIDISLFKGYIHGKNLTSGSQIRKVEKVDDRG